MTTAELEGMGDASPQLLDLALGRLARKDEVDILSAIHGTSIQLKVN
jgi:hypothetical protein